MDTGGLSAVADTPDNDAETGNNHDDDGGNFKEREPKLQLAEDLNTHQIDGADNQHHAEHPDPVRYRRKPDAHINSESRHVGNRDNQNFKAVGPAGDIARQRAEIILRIAGK